MQTEHSYTKKFSMTDLLEMIRHPRIVSFFMGWQYPIWIAFSVLVGRMTNLEVYFAVLDLVLISIAFVSCNSTRPILPIMISFLYRISLDHAPGIPYYSDYYSNGSATVIVLGIFLIIALASLVWMLVRKKLFTLANLKKLPLLVPLAVLSLAFLLAGAFSGYKTVSDVYFGLFQILFFAVIFWLLYLGFKDENAEELCSYFTYVCAVTAVILIIEVVHLYLTNEIISITGIINKGGIHFGWGISNTCANCLTVLVPICFLGVIKSRYHIAYFVIATLAYVANVFTLSRNGVLFGSIFYVISLIVCCFYGSRKKLYRYISLSLVAVCALGMFIFGDSIRLLFANMINSGLNDSGRYFIWLDALDVFCKYPIFGKGFFSFMLDIQYAKFIPFLAHNTVIEIMMAMGTFGIIAYLVYRAFTLIPFLKYPRIEKLMLLLSIGVLITESLIDNFILWLAPTITYNIAIIIAIKFCEQDSINGGVPEEAAVCIPIFECGAENTEAIAENNEYPCAEPVVTAARASDEEADMCEATDIESVLAENDADNLHPVTDLSSEEKNEDNETASIVG